MISGVLIAGFGGGVIRGLVGFIKSQFASKGTRFDLPYFFTMMFISGVIGFTVVAAVEGLGLTLLDGKVGSALAFIVGYAGGDLVENLYKIIFKTNTLFGIGD